MYINHEPTGCNLLYQFNIHDTSSTHLKRFIVLYRYCHCRTIIIIIIITSIFELNKSSVSYTNC